MSKYSSMVARYITVITWVRLACVVETLTIFCWRFSSCSPRLHPCSILLQTHGPESLLPSSWLAPSLPDLTRTCLSHPHLYGNIDILLTY